MMRIPIRWKLILSIGLPLLIIYSTFIWIEYQSLINYANERLRNHLKLMTGYYATRLEKDFSTVAQVASSTASYLTDNMEITEDELYQIIKKNVQQNDLIYGSCIAFEPRAYSVNKNLFAPYAFENESKIKTMDLSVDAYDYRNWEWYAAPKKANTGVWTEPYFDEGAGNILMCTYSVPFYLDDKFWGVATIDIPLTPLQNLIDRDKELAGGGFVIISSEGKYITTPFKDEIMKSAKDKLAQSNKPDMLHILNKIMTGKEGYERVENFPVKDPSLIYYTPIQSTGWALSIAYPEKALMEPIYLRLKENVYLMLIALVLIIACLLIISFVMTRPISKLAEGVHELATGNLDTTIEGVRSNDELGQLSCGFNKMVKDLKCYVNQLTEQTAAREAVESELRVAREIQTSLLPRSFPPFPQFDSFDLFAMFEPAKQVAGDYYDFFLVDDERMAIVMADVSGKGVPAAMFMAITRTIIRNLALNKHTPSEVLNIANDTLTQDNEKLFVTMFFGYYNIKTGNIVYANAGHPPPLAVKPDGSSVEFGETTGTLLGIFPDMTWDQNTETLNQEETLFLFTDGISEAHDPDGEMVGIEGLQELLSQCHCKCPKEYCNNIVSKIIEYENDQQSDDITVMALRRN